MSKTIMTQDDIVRYTKLASEYSSLLCLCGSSWTPTIGNRMDAIRAEMASLRGEYHWN